MVRFGSVRFLWRDVSFESPRRILNGRGFSLSGPYEFSGLRIAQDGRQGPSGPVAAPSGPGPRAPRPGTLRVMGLVIPVPAPSVIEQQPPQPCRVLCRRERPSPRNSAPFCHRAAPDRLPVTIPTTEPVVAPLDARRLSMEPGIAALPLAYSVRWAALGTAFAAVRTEPRRVAAPEPRRDNVKRFPTLVFKDEGEARSLRWSPSRACASVASVDSWRPPSCCRWV